MKKYIIVINFLLCQLSLAGPGGMYTTDHYHEIMDHLSNHTHPWAKKIYDMIKKAEKYNWQDKEILLNLLNKTTDHDDIIRICQKAIEKLHIDQDHHFRFSLALQSKNISVPSNKSLCTTLSYMMGAEKGQGIYEKAADLLAKLLEAPLEGKILSALFAEIPYYDGTIPVVKTALLYLYAMQENLDVLPDSLMKKLHNIHAYKIPYNDRLVTEKTGFLLYNQLENIFYKPSSSYEANIGAHEIEPKINPSKIQENSQNTSTIWDAYSFISTIIGTSVYLSGYDFLKAWKTYTPLYPYCYHIDVMALMTLIKDFDEPIVKEILKITQPLPDNMIRNDLKLGDILIWRDNQGGHAGFFLGYAENFTYPMYNQIEYCPKHKLFEKSHGQLSNKVIIAHSMRKEGKYEGTGISEVTLRRPYATIMAFRARDKDKN